MCPTGSALQSLKTSKPGLRSAFEVLDADRDGKISRDDLRSSYVAATDEVIKEMMSAADTDRDGYVEFSEFEKVLEGKGKGRKEENNGLMREVFGVMDRDGDGKVGEKDLREYMKWAGLEAHDEDIMAMIKLGGGGGGDDGVTFDGLMRILSV